MAPEVLRYNDYSKAADVYAWGIIIHEIYTKQYPYSEPMYSGWHINHLTYQIAHHGIRPDCSSINNIVKQLILDCLNEDPELRPTFKEIVARLKRIKKMKLKIENEDYTTVDSSRSLSDLASSQLPLLLDNSDGTTTVSSRGS